MRSELYAVGARVFLDDKGPPTPGVIVSPAPEGRDPSYKVVLLDGEAEPSFVRTPDMTSATLTAGRRVFRHTGGPPRFGVIPILGKTPRLISKARMNADEESIAVQWDNGDIELVVKNQLTPIVYEITRRPIV